MEIKEGLTFDDVLLTPGYSEVLPPGAFLAIAVLIALTRLRK